MEIIAALEETYGGRFPESELTQLETCRDVTEAVEAYLGRTPKAKDRRGTGEVLPEHYRVELFPEYLKLRQTMAEIDEAARYADESPLPQPATLYEDVYVRSPYMYLRAAEKDPAWAAAVKDDHLPQSYPAAAAVKVGS